MYWQKKSILSTCNRFECSTKPPSSEPCLTRSHLHLCTHPQNLDSLYPYVVRTSSNQCIYNWMKQVSGYDNELVGQFAQSFAVLKSITLYHIVAILSIM